MTTGIRVLIVACAAALCVAVSALAEVTVAPVFTDNMVLQRGMAVPVWGVATPGEEISIAFKGQKQSVKADSTGKWMVRLDPMKASSEGCVLTIASGQTATNDTRQLHNVLVGEVWVCSGQSNMEWGMRSVTNSAGEIASSDFPRIRLFSVPKTRALTPQTGLEGNPQWQECSPETVQRFSAVAYFFGRRLHNQLHVPIGLIQTAWGGTVCEAWTSAETLKGLPDFAPAVSVIEQLNAGTYDLSPEQAMEAWYTKNDPGSADKASWSAAGLDTGAWPSMDLPTYWETAGLPNYNGLVWFRKEFDLPPAWNGKDVMLHLGPIDDTDTTWVNGVKVGGMNNAYSTARAYKVPATVLTPGRNVIAVRVLDPRRKGGICGKAEQMKLDVPGDSTIAPITLAGAWRYRDSLSMAKAAPLPSDPRRGANVATVLYNGMIAPLVPYGIRGAIWYQGESNASRAYQYRTLFPAMIRDWRQQWGQGEFPFGFVQLANYRAVQPEPAASSWAELREAQHRTLALPHTGEAVIIDIGEARNIHPRNKQDVGLRLALWAEGTVYRRKGFFRRNIVYSGPCYQSMQVKGSKIRLTFEHIGGGLVGRGGEPLKQFAIAGEDQVFVWADAVIQGKTVVVSSDRVPQPVAVRYAWADNPKGCNLYNEAGLPASPFRTDDWPGRTADSK
ncbi:MAG: beta galactosidase jelly roll domain-containing protein [Kiritimatiellae bacterium]|nr:beta galactosidase jelly roll domain-containing protein [Kiritimatiellia bacterium]